MCQFVMPVGFNPDFYKIPLLLFFGCPKSPPQVIRLHHLSQMGFLPMPFNVWRGESPREVKSDGWGRLRCRGPPYVGYGY